MIVTFKTLNGAEKTINTEAFWLSGYNGRYYVCQNIAPDENSYGVSKEEYDKLYKMFNSKYNAHFIFGRTFGELQRDISAYIESTTAIVTKVTMVEPSAYDKEIGNNYVALVEFYEIKEV